MQLSSRDAVVLVCDLVALGVCLTQLRKLFQQRKQRKKEAEDGVFDEPKKQGVPKKFQKVDLDEFKWTSPSFTLESFQKILLRVEDQEARLHIMRDLDALATKKTKDDKQEERVDGEPVGYVRNCLGYTIFREVTGKPYGYPRYAEFVKMQDIVDRNFLDLIRKGILTYEKASPEVREKFNKAVMPRVKKGKVVAPLIPQQQTVR